MSNDTKLAKETFIVGYVLALDNCNDDRGEPEQTREAIQAWEETDLESILHDDSD